MGVLARVLRPSGPTHGRPPCSILLSPQDLVPMVPNLVMGIITEVLAAVGEVRLGLVMRRRTQGTSVRLQGPCGAPPALVLLLVAVVVSPLPQQLVGRDRGAAKWHGGGSA
jgi:hypothetical protein